MVITSGILIDWLQQSPFREDVFERVICQGKYEAFRVYSAGEPIRPEYIYICDGDIPTPSGDMEVWMRCLFLIGSGERISPTEELPAGVNLVVVRGQSPLRLLEYCYRMQKRTEDWLAGMNDAIYSGVTLQEFLTLSQPILENPLIIFGSSLNVLANSGNIAPDDKAFLRTVALGYTPPEIIGQIVERGYAEYSMRSDGKASVHEGNGLCPYTEVFQYIQEDGKTIAGITMHCSQREMTPGLLDLLGCFMDALARLLQHSPLPSSDAIPENAGYDGYFRYLLSDRELDADTAADLAQQLKFPFEAGFHLFVLNDLPDAPSSYTLARVFEVLPDAKCIYYEQAVVGLTAFQGKYRKEGEYTEALNQSLEYLVDYLGCNCGISRPFRNQISIRYAYVQAKAAAELGARITQSKNPYNTFHLREMPQRKLYFYSDLYAHHMAYCCSQSLPIKYLCIPELYRLLEYDKSHGTDNYKVLYLYLINNQKTSEAARLLHMHRNNVNYRIKRIEELFGLDLEDPETCTRLLFSFSALDLM